MQIPDDKRYFRIGEVSRIIGVQPYVLRYWESEFPQIRPARADSRHRTYQRKDLEIIMEIKQMTSRKVPPDQEFLNTLRHELQDILKTLS